MIIQGQLDLLWIPTYDMISIALDNEWSSSDSRYFPGRFNLTDTNLIPRSTYGNRRRCCCRLYRFLYLTDITDPSIEGVYTTTRRSDECTIVRVSHVHGLRKVSAGCSRKRARSINPLASTEASEYVEINSLDSFMESEVELLGFAPNSRYEAEVVDSSTP